MDPGTGPKARPNDSSTLAGAVLHGLTSAGLDTVFGVGGTHTLQLLGELERVPALRYIAARTELGAAYMAIGFARAAGRAAALLTSTGPGALNVVAALQDASWSCTPLVHLTTRIGDDRFAGALHETPAQGCILGLASKAVFDVGAADGAAALAGAIAVAAQHPRGPVNLQVSAGTWRDEWLPAGGPVLPGLAHPPEIPVDALASAIAASSRPVIFAGGGAMAADGGAAVRLLASTIGAPVLTSNQGKGIGDWSDELYLGPWGWEPAVHQLFAEADLALVFGSKLSASGTGQWQLPLPAASYAIGLPPLDHPRYPQLTPVAGDAAEVARSLQPAVTARASWARQRVAQLRSGVLAAAAERGPAEMSCVASLSAEPATPRWVSFDMAKAGFWLMKYLPARRPGTHLFSGYLAMGTALPMAIGAAVATGEPSMAVVGDGGFQMSIAELATIAEHRLPITVLIIVDGLYGLLRDNRLALGDAGTLGVELWNPDLPAVAEAYGIECHHAADGEALGKILATSADGPRLILLTSPFSRAW
ncbi:MAG TPA: thiamine pyrophosphate-dependent enzyme [Jatrophihabitantaceae bacterium]|jgi:acetolactate synthase-1/2/3 large subunit|nr:thiamine pyrophosphate-dependent enzyme [Jatrophihabitantaceae bacterium]